MYESPKRGIVSLTMPHLCRVFGAANMQQAEKILLEILNPQFNIVDYFNEGSKHTIVNRRMVRETKISQARSESGKKGADVTKGKTKQFADDLTQQNGQQNQNFDFDAANNSTNESAKNQQNCNSNNSNNSNSSNNIIKGIGVKGERETTPQIGPELKAVWMKHRRTYQFEMIKDAAPLHLIGEAIAKGENVSAL